MPNTVTLSLSDGTLVPAWEASGEDEYTEGANNPEG